MRAQAEAIMTASNDFHDLPPWWKKIDQNPDWQEFSFIGLAIGYGLIALVALVQLLRIQRRVPEYGWTTQKVFHLLNAFVCALRCIVFAMRERVQNLHPLAAQVYFPALCSCFGLLVLTLPTSLACAELESRIWLDHPEGLPACMHSCAACAASCLPCLSGSRTCTPWPPGYTFILNNSELLSKCQQGMPHSSDCAQKPLHCPRASLTWGCASGI